MDLRPRANCPQCRAQLRVVRDDGTSWACPEGHRFDLTQLPRIALADASRAVWDAVRALELRAVALDRLSHDIGDPRYATGGQHARLHAEVLRELAYGLDDLSKSRDEGGAGPYDG